MRSPWKRLAAALGLTLVPLCLGPVPPASAGGGWGITVTATMDGENQRLLVGTLHALHVTVLDAPGEASLRDILVTVVDPDPSTFPVVCDAGANGHMSLEPMRALHCTAEVTALPGPRSVVTTATATVPGVPGRLQGSATVRYFGYMLPPPPPVKPAPAAPVKQETTGTAVKPHEPGAGTKGNPPANPPADPPKGSGSGPVPGTANPPGHQGPGGDPGCPGDPGGSDRVPQCACPPAGEDPGACSCPAGSDSDHCDCPTAPAPGSSGSCDCRAGAASCESGDHVAAPPIHHLARTGSDAPLIGAAGLMLLGAGALLAGWFRKTRA